MANTLIQAFCKEIITIAMIVCQLNSCQAGQCDALLSRQLIMAKTSVNPIQATPVNTVTVKTLLVCQSQCLAVDTCAYITFSQSTNTCTLYSTATTSVNVAAGLHVYAYNTKNIAYSDPSCYPCASNPCQHNGTCTNVFSPDAQYTCTCTSQYTGIQCQSSNSVSAFYVGSNQTNIAANTTNIVFNVPVTTTVYSPYNINSKTVTSVPDSGVYWFQLAAGVPANTTSNTRLNGLQYPIAIVTSTTNFPDDIMVTDTIQYVNTSTQLTVSNADSVFGTINGVKGTSVLGYRLDNIMSTQVYFSVQCTATYIAASTVITFDRVLINVGNAWSAANSKFTAPYSGNYFFSLALAAPKGSASMAIYLMLNTASAFATDVDDNIHNNYTMARGATMLTLSANAVVTYTSYAAGNYGSTDGLINAQCFLYSPLGGAAAAVAWGVTVSGIIKGPVTAVPFSTVNVNIQGVWSTTTNKITIPVAGTYFIDLTAYLRGSADCGTNGNNVIKVILNTQPVITVQLLGYTSNAGITRSRSVIANLNVGDRLYVTLLSGTCISPVSHTQFSGFRLF